MRLFVGLEVPAHVRVLTEAAAAPARAARAEVTWTRPEGWHVTLAFLGEVADGTVTRLDEPLAAVSAAHPPIDLRLGPAGRFAARALWLAVEDDPSGAVMELGDHLQRAVADLGLPVQHRRVHPHLTLARARRGATVDQALVETVAPVSAAWAAEDVALFRVALGDGPARYDVVRRWPLGATDARAEPARR